ncbi:uncharacterized protein LOC113238718 [Hyposmocoma kahamanoa]|uniref:uncharacterized protein LOC113238718 n=1 Tax=Hyposmocoma kahamanoa TaxID=1477025 RepID=UPI000E6D755E|nr:uncharacterized protein LOC113238718 [Hyposmocoma kahamanoa]XP_026331343.1 uncharacterized protein LOC113238718 [Hyposmocoma kahamanoa]
MLRYLFLLFVTLVAANKCPYQFEGIPYTRKSMLTIKGLPTNLAYNSINNDLYFTLIDIDSLQNDNEQTKMDQYILRDGKPIKIDNIHGQAAAVDTNNGTVYIASDDGLNILNSTDHANFISLKDEDIVQIFKPIHKNELYVVVFPENEVYKLNVEKNEKRKVAYVPCAFILAVDHHDNIYYECDSKYVKVLLKDFSEPVEFVGIAKNNARAMAVDMIGRVILAANDGIYHLRPDNIIPKKLMNLDFVPSAIAFDNKVGTMYLATNGIIYEYSVADAKTCV